MQAQLHKDQLSPPKGVQASCRRGLELRPKYGGDGLTDAAVSRARSMASGKAVSADTLKRIKAYHARHTYEKQSSPPSPGYVAYLLWGGQAGKTWANAKADNVQKSEGSREGSRGGHIIGHTRSGKPVYGGGHASYHQRPYQGSKGFTADDHRDAQAIHNKVHHQAYRSFGATAESNPTAREKHKRDFHDSLRAYNTHTALWSRAQKTSLRKSEGSRGGHIIGHTKSGKPIYSAHHDMNRVRGKAALHASHELIGYSPADHADAASRHMRAYQKLSGTKPNRAMAHLKLAAGHSGIATGKDLMKPVKQPKAEMSGMHSSYENHKGLAAFHLREGDMKTKVAPDEALWHYAQAGLHSDKAITMRHRTN